MSYTKKLSAYDFAHLASLADPQVSVDGRFATYIRKSAGKSYVVLAQLDGKLEKVIHEVPVKGVHAFGSGVTQLSGDGTVLYFVTISGGIAKIDLASGGIDDVYGGPGVSQISLSADADRIAGVVFGDRVAIFDTSGIGHPIVVSEVPRQFRSFGGLPTEVGHFVSDRPDFVFDVDLSPSGDIVIWHEWALPNMPWQRSQIVYVDLKSQDVSPVINVIAGGDYFVSQPRFSPDGKKIGFLAEVYGYHRLWLADLSKWSAVLAVDEEFEHGGAPWGNGNRTFDFSRDGNSVYFSRNEAGHGRLVSMNLATSEVTELAKAHHFGVKTSNSSLVALRSGAKTPSAIVSYELPSRKRTEIESAYSEPFYSASSVEPIFGSAPYSTSLHSFVKAHFRRELAVVKPIDVPYRLYRPEGEGGALPTIVTFHGGPTDQALVTYSVRNIAFMQAGFQVVSFDYRGSTGWGKSFRESLDTAFGVAEIVDVLSVLADLRNRRLAEPGAIVVNGGSSGGYSALRSVCMTRGLFCGGIAAYPLIHLAESAASTHRFESRYFDRLIGRLPDEINLYLHRSVVASELDDVPLLILHGDSDPVVNHRQVVRFVENAHSLGKSVEFILFKGEGHGFSASETIEAEFLAYDRFLAGISTGLGFQSSW